MSRSLGLLVVAAVLMVPGAASAYPWFQITSGTDTCSTCHVSPSGGGALLTPWGRGEDGDTLSQAGGDGSFLHGAVDMPGWLALQGEFRVAGLVNDTGSPDGAELAFFPMQTDFAAGFFVGDLSAVVSVGYRGQVREPDPQPASSARQIDDQDLLSYFISREHYLMWKPAGRGPYARAGRFYAPYGLRLPDHTTYIRRYLGQNLMEETYGVSGGWIARDWEAHLTAFTDDPWRGNGRDEVGAAALYERRIGDHVVGAQGRLSLGDHDKRGIFGGYGKLWLDPLDLLILGEVDVARQTFDDVAGGDRWQIASYVGPVYIPTHGVYLGLQYEVFDTDLAVKDVTRQAFGGWVSYLPYAHVEILATIRSQLIGPSDGATVGLLQLHYTL